MKKIYIWGTGCGAGKLLETSLDIGSVSAFIDSSPGIKAFMDRPVFAPEYLVHQEYDLIIVASRSCKEIRRTCIDLGLDMKKILFMRNHFTVQDINESYERAEEILGAETVGKWFPEVYLVQEPRKGRRCFSLSKKELENDYVRMKTLEFIAAKLHGVEGCAAELGVYRGVFARCINMLMPERRLYLFDTFRGFDKKEALEEAEQGHCGEGFIRVHENTDAEKVLEQMPYKENVVIRQGLFPDSLHGLEEKFAFVSLDADFEDSTYAGLVYFVPRMSKGGYIFLHDYNSPELSGVSAALARYETDYDIRLHGVPLCDINGTLVISL